MPPWDAVSRSGGSMVRDCLVSVSSREDGYMSGFPTEALTVLAAAVGAARQALREMDPDDAPESLRRVVASSSGRLPPPLARSLLRELDRNQWLRDEALEQLEGDGPSRGFLEHLDGWWVVVADAIADDRADAEAAKAQQAEAQVAALASEVHALKAKAKETRREANTAAAAAKVERTAGRKRLEVALAASRSELAAKREMLEDGTRAVEAALAERDEADAASREVGRRLRALRRELAELRAGSAQAAATSAPREGIALARHLDLLAAMVPAAGPGPAPAAQPATSAAESSSDPAAPEDVLAVPAGIRPDAGEVVVWLLGQPTGFALVVDGHNVLFHLDPATATTGEARKRLVTDLARFRKQAAATPAVVVVFDSHIPGSREPGFRDGVELLYAEAGVAADDLVVGIAREFSVPVVVVSSDRAVRERAESTSVFALWSEALGEWLRRP